MHLTWKVYPSYKPSGMAWLGEIPAHWTVRRLKTIASVQLSNVDKKSVEGQEPIKLCNYTDVYYNEQITNNIEFMQATATPEQVRRFALKPEDVLITKDSESWTDIAVPAVIAAELPGVVCGYHLALIRPNDNAVHGRFLARAFSAVGPRDQFQIAANGITRYGLTEEAIKSSLFGLPPLAEQHAIAKFLDRETAKIDALIAKKERLIELLQEKRTALITQAVTKGLDPNVPMKNSGVEWLGKMPANWKVTSLKRIGDLQAGAGFPDEEQGLESEEIPFFKVGDMGLAANKKEMINCPNTISQTTARILRAYKFPPKTIVFAKVGAALLLNRRRLLSRLSCIDNNMMGFIPEKCNSGWALYWLCGLDLGELANPGAVPSVNEGQMRDTLVVVPPLNEQRSIAEFLDRETAKIDVLVTKITDVIERLNEFRMALISAAVTGKVDVQDMGLTAQSRKR